MSIFKKKPQIQNDILTAYVTMPDGTDVQMQEGKYLDDGTCLIADDGQYYHTIVACCGNFSGWRLTTVKEAKKAGYIPCYICEEEVWKRQQF